jgi:hypothetical protein
MRMNISSKEKRSNKKGNNLSRTIAFIIQADEEGITRSKDNLLGKCFKNQKI